MQAWHGGAMQEPRAGEMTISEDIRRAIQQSPDSLRVVAQRFGIDPKTVAKWRARSGIDDLRRGPKPGRHGRLTAEEQDIVVRFREHTLLPLDDCLYALQAHIPHLSRSGLHRCLQRHGISRLTGTESEERGTGLPPGLPGEVHIDLSVVRSKDGVHFLFNAIEQASKFVIVRMAEAGDDHTAAQFLERVVDESPFRIARVVTADAPPFGCAGQLMAFGAACQRLAIDHSRMTNPHPRLGNPGVRIGRLLADDPTFASEAYLAALVDGLVLAYNFRRRLKTLGGKTPHAFLCASWLTEPNRFQRDPHHELAGPDCLLSRGFDAI